MRLRVLVTQEAESYGMPWSAPRPMEKFMTRLSDARGATELEDPYFRFNGVTIMRDGSCHPGGLRMKTPYLGPYGEPTEGISYISAEKAVAAMRFCAEYGMRLDTIAMGSQAHEENLAELEQIAQEFDISGLKWVLVHAFFVDAEQTRRYARLGLDMTTTRSSIFATPRSSRPGWTAPPSTCASLHIARDRLPTD